VNQHEVEIVRDAALSIEDTDLEMAYQLMCLANRYRPQGNFIKRKKDHYKQGLQIDNGPVNIHLGAHKTATTYIQENLELVNDSHFQYTQLDVFREKTKGKKYFNYLNSLDWTKNTLISDENIIGDNGTILTGSLYPDFKRNSDKILSHLKNRELINLFISIRPFTAFLPSQYCEYLRWNKYLSYRDFTAKTDVAELKWIDVLHDTIQHNKDLTFHIFDFCYFSKNKNTLLSHLSVGYKKTCDSSIQPSRASLTYKELCNLSNHADYSASEAKFDPHSAEEKRLSALHYQQDIGRLAELPNATMIQ
jgi:hypothetical protein